MVGDCFSVTDRERLEVRNWDEALIAKRARQTGLLVGIDPEDEVELSLLLDDMPKN